MPNPEKETTQHLAVPLSEQLREMYPTVIYEESSNVADSQTMLAATVSAVNAAGHNVIADVGFDESTGTHTTIIRTAAAERHEQAVEGALIHGTARAMSLKFEEMKASAPEVVSLAPAAASTLVNQITAKADFYEAFANYYGGARWHLDQERFIGALFTESVVYSAEAAASEIAGEDISSVVFELDLDIPYEKRKEWRKKTPAEIFEEVPELDYRRLEDEAFRESPEGQKLQECYRKILGYKLAQHYTSGRREITAEGIVIPKPVIPIARFPVVEALLADEISANRHNLGTSDVHKVVVRSDSAVAHEALVGSITTRVPKEDRHVFDGPGEFYYKQRDVTSLLHEYEKNYGDDIQQEQFKEYLITILRGYSNSGAIATEIRHEWQARVESGNDWTPAEVLGVKDIVKDIMITGLASPDAEEFIAIYMPDFEKGLVLETDPMTLTATEQKIMLLEALGKISSHSQSDVFERMGTRIFQDPSIGTTLREIAELRIQASQKWDTPQIRLARRNLGSYMTDSPEEAEAKARLDELTAPAEALYEQAHIKLNNLLIGYLSNMADSGALNGERNDTSYLFGELLKKVYIGDTYRMEALPEVYQDLTALAERADIPDAQKSTILWHVASRLEHGGSKIGKFLTPAIIDIYRIMLGPVGQLRLPTKETSSGLEAANVIARGTAVFKHASQDELLTLASYKVELASLVGRINSGAVPAETGIAEEGADEAFRDWQHQHMKNAANVVRKMSQLEELYTEYLHLEEVKVKPQVYYPWLLERFAPFWSKMQWAMDSGNEPKPNVSRLHAVLEDHVANLLVLQEGDYAEDFDAVNEGHVDSLLLECYERMVLDHDIQYNNTVWQEGLPFLSYAVSMMPSRLVEQIRQAHPDDSRYDRFLDYVEKTRARWNKEP